MLKPEDQQTFASLIAQLQIDDPAFGKRTERLNRPPARWAILAVALWAVAPICIIFGGWTGVIEAVLAVCYGTHLLRKRQRWAAAASSTPDQPSAAL
ncbi:DUF3040 domain-containing protein [Actinoplanes utahensis]|uniref:DUF3040 domain-containing protein n=1 Tax=Actinoplanes utahensis TaxID=1869 RepID=UPI000AA6D50B|nr:DUF3040 domain-containing protein [Actinoplanes utahensis]GIF29601.1 hypothetical protein Aut01nite_25870 [Actinoplanes utahensis]